MITLHYSTLQLKAISKRIHYKFKKRKTLD